MFKKIFGVLIMIFGVLSLVLLFVEFSLINLFLPLLLIFLGYKLFKSNKSTRTKAVHRSYQSIKDNQNSPTAPSSSSIKKTSSNTFYFKVVGISKKNDEGKDIQKLIKQYVKDEIDSGEEVYEGLTNKEIIEDGYDEIYEVDLYGFDEINLIPEPDNPYDPDAIKVFHEEIGHIGYVPSDMTSRVRAALKKGCNIEWKLLGGKKKVLDDLEDKVLTETLNYGMSIEVKY